MKTQIASATRTLQAPADEIYRILADYRTLHPLILPRQYFLLLDVEEGGFGEGTIIRFHMRLFGRTQAFRSLITEPEPGRVLLETDLGSGIVTRFTVSPLGSEPRTQVTIATELPRRNALEGFLARAMLRKVYREELRLIARVTENRVRSSWSNTADGTPIAPSQ